MFNPISLLAPLISLAYRLIVQPKLKIVVDDPLDHQLCQNATRRIRIVNVGRKMASNVKVMWYQIPEECPPIPLNWTHNISPMSIPKGKSSLCDFIDLIPLQEGRCRIYSASTCEYKMWLPQGCTNGEIRVYGDGIDEVYLRVQIVFKGNTVEIKQVQ